MECGLAAPADPHDHEQGLRRVTQHPRNMSPENVVDAIEVDGRLGASRVGGSPVIALLGMVIAAALVFPCHHRVALCRNRLGHRSVFEQRADIARIKPEFPRWDDWSG